MELYHKAYTLTYIYIFNNYLGGGGSYQRMQTVASKSNYIASEWNNPMVKLEQFGLQNKAALDPNSKCKINNIHESIMI